MDEKKQVIKKVAEGFKTLDKENKMFILGYMTGVGVAKDKKSGQQKGAEEAREKCEATN